MDHGLFEQAKAENLSTHKAVFMDVTAFIDKLKLLGTHHKQKGFRTSEIMIWGIDSTRAANVYKKNSRTIIEERHFLADTDFFSAGSAMLKYLYDQEHDLGKVIDFLAVLVVFLPLQLIAKKDEIKAMYICWRALLCVYDLSRQAPTEQRQNFYKHQFNTLLEFRDVPYYKTFLLNTAETLLTALPEKYKTEFNQDFEEILLSTMQLEDVLPNERLNILKPVCDIFIKETDILDELSAIFALVKALLSTLDDDNPSKVIDVAAQLHNGIIAIHPFEDKNGRIAQSMANDLCELYGIGTIIFEKSQAYDQAVRQDFKNAPQRVRSIDVNFVHLATFAKSQYESMQSHACALNEQKSFEKSS